jgi:hypothetical protein
VLKVENIEKGNRDGDVCKSVYRLVFKKNDIESI